MNEKGEKREIKRMDKPNRTMFVETLEGDDILKKGVLAEFQIKKALVRCKFTNLPEPDQMHKLYKALEVVVGEGDINYRDLLAAPVSRETSALNGIFPKIVTYTIFTTVIES